MAVQEDLFYQEDLRQLAKAVHYQNWQVDMVKNYVKGHTLEVGGGIGNFTRQLARLSHTVTTVEPNKYCIEQLRAKVKDLPNVTVIEGMIEDVDITKKFDTIILMNVLEHIRDDYATIAALKKLLTQDGQIVVLVPSCQWAFGTTDQRLDHFRRYDKPMARKLATATKLDLIALRYYNFVGIWGWWFNARILKHTGQSSGQIFIFDNLIVPILSRIERYVHPPVGQSILFVFRNQT